MKTGPTKRTTLSVGTVQKRLFDWSDQSENRPSPVTSVYPREDSDGPSESLEESRGEIGRREMGVTS